MPQGTSGVSTGYRPIGVWVANFDGAPQKLAALGTRPLLAPLGEPGERRTCVCNPPIFAFFLIELWSRRMMHAGVTRSPSSAWVTQQRREATAWGEARAS